VMGALPLVQNNYIRHWAGIGMYTNIFGYDASSKSYSYANGVLAVQNNTGCDGYDMTTFDSFGNEGNGGVPFDSNPITVNYSGDQYSASCASIAAPPALYPQVIVPPELLDSTGGMWAITNSTDTGPNTYWPNINAASGQ